MSEKAIGEESALWKKPGESYSGRWIVAPLLVSLFFMFSAWLVKTQSPKQEDPVWESNHRMRELQDPAEGLSEIKTALRSEGIDRAQCGGNGAQSMYERNGKAFPAKICDFSGNPGIRWKVERGGAGEYIHFFAENRRPTKEETGQWVSFLSAIAREAKRNTESQGQWERQKAQSLEEEAALAKRRLGGEQ